VLRRIISDIKMWANFYGSRYWTRRGLESKSKAFHVAPAPAQLKTQKYYALEIAKSSGGYD
jgi:hypothetical protein